jgi:hypothetical protein
MDDAIELGFDEKFQRREWAFQRVGWCLLACAVLAGAAGLFGDGALSDAVAQASDGSLHVTYDRFPRKRAPGTIVVHVRRSAAAPISLWISRESARVLGLERIVPEPTRESGDSERLILEFEGEGDVDRPLVVTLHVEPVESGRLDTRLGTVNGATLAIRQVIYP